MGQEEKLLPLGSSRHRDKTLCVRGLGMGGRALTSVAVPLPLPRPAVNARSKRFSHISDSPLEDGMQMLLASQKPDRQLMAPAAAAAQTARHRRWRPPILLRLGCRSTPRQPGRTATCSLRQPSSVRCSCALRLAAPRPVPVDAPLGAIPSPGSRHWPERAHPAGTGH